MKPIAVLQHDADVAPGYFSTWLQQREIPSVLIRIDRGEAMPRDPRAFAGICSLGGRMSVSDALPWINQELALLRAADRAAVPVIGHCLGGQLLAKAFGAAVRRNVQKEIGWCEVQVSDIALAREWIGADMPASFPIFQWHEDTFDIPAGARNFLASAACAHQAYVIDRGAFAHLGMQFHCEMTPELISAWSEREDNVEALRAGAIKKTAHAQSAIALKLYERWSQGLAR